MPPHFRRHLAHLHGRTNNFGLVQSDGLKDVYARNFCSENIKLYKILMDKKIATMLDSFVKFIGTSKTRKDHLRASARNTVRIRLMRATHHVT